MPTLSEYEASLSDFERGEIARGKWLCEHYEGDFVIDGQIMGMADYLPMKAYRRDQAMRQHLRGDCCGQTEAIDTRRGLCGETGCICPLWRAAKKLDFKLFGGKKDG